jgi:hypothetical protein
MAAFTRRQYAGSAVATTLTAGINTTDTTCSLAATTGWPSTAGVSFYVVIDPGTSTEEKCSATISGSTLTLVRGQDDTSASSHASGATVYPVFTANDADEANEVASKLTTKGDLLVTTGSALNRLAVGSNRQQLAADSTATKGVKWQYEGDLGTPNAQTGTTYTFILTDSATLVTFANASPITATIPANSSVAFPIGTQINILQIDAGQITVAASGGVTLRSEASRVKTRAAYAMATIVKLGTNEWVIVGNVVA